MSSRREAAFQRGHEELGRVLRDLRQGRGWTQAEVAKRSGLSVGFLSQLELGRRKPTLETLLTLADCYDMLLTELLDGVYPFGRREAPGRRTPPEDGRRRPAASPS